MQDGAPITEATPVAFHDPLPDAVDVAIVGGGVIGVFASLYLARRGMRVLLCEKGRIAGEQSSRNWGWIRQQGRDEAELPIMARALELWHAADRDSGGRCGVVTCGTSYLAHDEATRERHEAWLAVARRHGLDTRALSRREIAEAFSGMGRHDWSGGITTPSDARGEPSRAVPAVARLARQAGAAIREDCAVRAVEAAGGKVSRILTESGPVRCEQVVLAAGAWSSLFARRHGIDLPQLSVRATVARTGPLPGFFSGAASDGELALRLRDDGGYTLAVPDRQSFPFGPDAFRHARRYLPVLRSSWRAFSPRPWAPRGYPDGWATPRRWDGGEKTPFERIRVLSPPPDARDVRAMRTRFAARFPGIGSPAILGCWAGMIDAMPDVVPVVDRVPGLDGLIVATGMSGHGFGIGPGFADVVARMAAGEPAGFDLRRFRIGRFTDGSPLQIGPGF